MRQRVLIWAFGILLSLFLLPGDATAQTSDLRGRVMDRETGEAVRDATVVLEGQDTAFLMISDSRGLFAFPDIGGGEYQVRVTHIAYGEHEEAVSVAADAVVALRVMISLQAIELDPVVVEAMSQRELDSRSRGTMIQEITREEIERAARTSGHLGDVMRQTIPGIRVFDSRLPGARVCIEFRGRRSIRLAGGCQTPMVILDGVRMFDPPGIYNMIDPSSIQRIEVIPPTEAGLLYGSESAFGVITIETKVWLTNEEREAIPDHLKRGVYDWTLETETHSWKKVFLSAFIGNALGLAAGIGIADQCVEFGELATDLFATRCGRWKTAGSWASAISFPLVGAALGSRVSGGTPISRGSFFPTLATGAIALLPGYALVTSSSQNTSSASFRAGQVFVLVGIPAAVTVADHIFRKFRGR